MIERWLDEVRAQVTLETLNHLRFIAPGIIAICFAAILGWLSGMWSIKVPELKDAATLLVFLLPAALYYVTPVRTLVNKLHADRITNNIVDQFVRIGRGVENEGRYQWSQIKTIFYPIIDKDPSLSQKAKLAYANGFIWTTCADVTALSAFYLIISIVIAFGWGNYGALVATSIFGITAIASFFGSVVTTKRHLGISQEQLDIIEDLYANDVRSGLERIDARQSR
jgi:hypothetical protein